MFDNPNNQMLKIENEADLHCKVVEYIIWEDFILKPSLLPGSAKTKRPLKRESINGKKVIWKDSQILWSWTIIKITTASALNSRAPEIIKKSVKLNWRWRNGINKMDTNSSFPMIMIWLNLSFELLHGRYKNPCKHCCKQFLSYETYQTHLEKFHKL